MKTLNELKREEYLRNWFELEELKFIIKIMCRVIMGGVVLIFIYALSRAIIGGFLI